ncbi:MAG: hypothetical protein NVS3B20_24800 [Polyangiales bacterium]
MPPYSTLVLSIEGGTPPTLRVGRFMGDCASSTFQGHPDALVPMLCSWAGAQTSFGVFKRGASLVVRSQDSDEGPARLPEKMLGVIKVPEGATVIEVKP